MDEQANQDQDFSKLSLEDRLNHKNWKARLSGYEELTKLFPMYEDKEFQRYAPMVKKFVIDSNAAAQEKGLAATLAFVDYCPNAGKYVENIIAGVATKCLSASRAKTKELAGEIVLMCVEIEKQDVVVEELIKALDQKTPKNVAATIAMLRRCLNQFGHSVISVKPMVPVLAKLLEDRDRSVRDETKLLTIEIYRWVKDALLPQLSNLKPIILADFEEEFKKIKPDKAHPERLLRSQQQRQQQSPDGEAVANDGDSGGEEKSEPEMDPFDLLDPVDILAKLPPDFYTLIEAKKWTERKDGLEKLQALLDAHPKLLSTADYSELVKQLRKIIGKDTNIVVATFAIKCLAQLAGGLRKNFHSHAHGSIPVILEKFKEKKPNVVQALREAVDTVYLSTNLEAISEDLVAALDNKNPSIRSETALFLARSFAKTNPHTINKKLLKTLTTSLIKTLSDSDATVRESSAEALGTALKAQGDRNMGPLLQGLESLKMSKIEEVRAKVEVKKFSAPPAASTTDTATGNSASSGGAKSTKPEKAAPLKADVKRKPKPATAPKTRPENSSSTVPAAAPKLTSVRGGGGGARTATSSTRLIKGQSNHQSSSNLGPGGASTATVGAGGSGSSATKKQQDQDAGPLMNDNLKMKEQRLADERALKVLRWNFTTPREEFYQLLREQMTAAEWQPQLVTYCFHNDFKYHIKAIDMMRDFFQKQSTEEYPVAVANLDLVLKWIALRFFDTNPSVITKALELLLVLFSICDERHQYQMNDSEANSFVPYLVLKVGDPKDAVRNKVHEILARMRSIYPPNKIFAHLFTGLQSKNARQRSTCLEEISHLIELRGMSIFQPPNSLQLIKDLAKFIADRDNMVRNAALSCVVQVYFLEGERVFKLIGSLSDKEMSLVEERIKRTSKQQQKAPASARPAHNSASQLPTAEISNISTIPTISGAGKFSSDSRLLSGGALPAPTEFQTTSETAPSYEIGATFSKNRTHSNLMKRSPASSAFLSGGRSNSNLMSPTQHSQSRMTPPSNAKTYDSSRNDDGETSSDHNNDWHQEPVQSSDLSEPHSQATTDKEFSSDYYSNTDDDELRQKVKQALSLPDIKLVRRYHPGSGHRSDRSSSSSTSNGAAANSGLGKSPRYSSPMATGGPGRSPAHKPDPSMGQIFAVLFVQLSSTDLKEATEAMVHLNNSLKDYDQYGPFLEPKIDQLLILCNKQYRLFLTKHYPAAMTGSESDLNDAMALFRITSAVLSKIFKGPSSTSSGSSVTSLGKKVSRDTLRELITHLMTYLVDMRQNHMLINTIQYLIFHVIFPDADATNLLSALIRMLFDYVGDSIKANNEPSAKFLDITMKFLWRITKTSLKAHTDSNELNIDQILYESHLFFHEYPRTWWKMHHLDDLPLRTIKTLVYHIVTRKGDAILNHFTLIKNKDESEMFLYVQKALRQSDRAAAAATVNGNASGTTNTNTPTGSRLSLNSFLKSPIDSSLSNKDLLAEGYNKERQKPAAEDQRFDYGPLRVRQMNIDNRPVTIPAIQNQDDMRRYVEHMARNLNCPQDQINYNMIVREARIPSGVNEARAMVEQAQQRLNLFKTYLNANNYNL